MRPPVAAVSLAVAVLAGAGAAHAASFDCAHARAADERAVCADRGLNDQDVRMTVMFDFLRGLHAMGVAGAMRDEQRAWLARRHACGGDRACLSRLYAGRVHELQAAYDALDKPI